MRRSRYLPRSLAVGLCALSLLTLGTARERAAAVTGGAADGLAHPYVGVLTYPGAPRPGCSAVLVRNDAGAAVALTDAHCVRDGSAVRVAFWHVWNPYMISYPGIAHVDPALQPGSLLHDLAVIVFSVTPRVVPAELAPIGAAAGYSSVTTVGFGQPHSGQRRSATEIRTAYDGAWLYLRPGTGNTCDGDSGGPDLAPGTDVVLALTDQGSCTYDEDTRVDTASVHQLVDAFTPAAASPRITAALAASTIRAGGWIAMTGRTSPGYRGQQVLREGYFSGAWHVWASGTVAGDGTVRFVIHPTVVTTDVYRLVLPSTPTHAAAVSPSLTLTVTP